MKSALLGALFGVLTLVALVASSLFAEARPRHVVCNNTDVMRPCATSTVSQLATLRKFRTVQATEQSQQFDVRWDYPTFGHATSVKPTSRREARRIARGQRLEQSMPFGAAIVPPETQRSWLSGISKPARYVGGRLICAINVNAALAERGIRGTGSALAHSFDGWGVRSPVPVVGAVAVTDRRGGGHVAIVSRVEGGRVFVWNPSSRGRGWREVEYTNRHARYRVAG